MSLLIQSPFLSSYLRITVDFFSGRYYELVTTSNRDQETEIFSVKERGHEEPTAKDIETTHSSQCSQRKSTENLPYNRNKRGK